MKIIVPLSFVLLFGLGGGCATAPTAADHRPPESAGTAPVLPREALDQLPIARVQGPPIYPSDLRKQGITGYAVIEFIVDPQGNVSETTVREASHAEFGLAAADCVSRWKFSPGRKSGRPVYVRMTVPIRFDKSPAPPPPAPGAPGPL